MKILGPNLYRVYYRIPEVKDSEFNALVIAHSIAEAEAYLKEYTIVKTSVVDSNITIVIPKQYLQQ